MTAAVVVGREAEVPPGRGQRGATMVTVMLTMFIVMSASAALVGEPPADAPDHRHCGLWVGSVGSDVRT